MERDFLAKKLNQPDGKLNAINAQLERDLAVANNHPKNHDKKQHRNVLKLKVTTRTATTFSPA